jgi:YNFM family putative membrane transporter
MNTPLIRPASPILDFIALLYAATLMMTVIYGPQPLFTAIHADFPVSEASISLLVSVTMLPLGIAPLFYGALLGSVSARRLLRIGMFLLAAAGLPIFFTHSFPVLFTARLLQGLLVPAVLTALMTHISSRYRGAELQRAMAIYVGATILGGLFGRLICAALAEWLGWRHAMLLLSLALGLGAAAVSGLSGETPSGFNRVRLSDFTRILKNSVLLRLLLFEAGGLFVFIAVGNCLPFYLNSLESGISELRVAVMYSGYALGALAAFSSRRLLRAFGGEMRVITAALCLFLVAMPAFFSADTRVIFAAMLAICLAQFTQHSICLGLINRLCAEERGVVNGLCLSFYYTGGAAGSYVSVLLFTHFSWETCVVLLSVILLAMLGNALSLKNAARTF